MRLKALFPMITTRDLVRTERFYAAIGFDIAFASDVYLKVAWPDDGGIQIGFLLGDHVAHPPIQRTPFEGRGLSLCLQVEDVEAVHAVFKSVLPLDVPLRDEPCGQRRFAVTDPNGVVIDIMGPIRAKQPADRSAADGAADGTAEIVCGLSRAHRRRRSARRLGVG